MNEILSTIIYHPRDITTIGQGVFLVDVLLMYQRFAKRYDPEVINFIEHAIFMIVPEPEKLDISKLLSISESVAKTSMFNFL